MAGESRRAPIAESVLIGWLCVLRNQFEHGDGLQMPGAVYDALIARGWIDVDADPDWDGKRFARPTDAANSITDIHGPDWGVETLDEAEA